MRTALAALAICALGAPAQAALFTGTAIGSFGTGSTGNQPTFHFGDTPASFLAFQGYTDGLGFAGDIGTPFAIGDVTALKNPTPTYPNTGTAVVLTTTLTFTAPIVTTQTLTFTLDIGLFPGLIDGTTDADLFGTGDIEPDILTLGGQRYDLALVGFDPDAETNDISLQQGIPYAGQLFAQITPDPTPVPEPTTLALVTLPLLATLRRPTR